MEKVVQVVSSKSLPDFERFTFLALSFTLQTISGSFSNIPERLSLTCFCVREKVTMVPRSLCNKLTVTFGIVLLSFEIILGTCIKRDEQIQKYLTSSESPFDNYFNISRAVYPSVDLPSLLINISVVFRKTANEKSNGSNSWSTLERNVSRSTLNFTWSMSWLVVRQRRRNQLGIHEVVFLGGDFSEQKKTWIAHKITRTLQRLSCWDKQNHGILPLHGK